RRHSDIGIKEDVEALGRDNFPRAIQIVGDCDISIGIAPDRIADGVGVLRRTNHRDLEPIARKLLNDAVIELPDGMPEQTGGYKTYTQTAVRCGRRCETVRSGPPKLRTG